MNQLLIKPGIIDGGVGEWIWIKPSRIEGKAEHEGGRELRTSKRKARARRQANWEHEHNRSGVHYCNSEKIFILLKEIIVISLDFSLMLCSKFGFLKHGGFYT